MLNVTGDRVITSDAEVGVITFAADGKVIAGLCRDGKVRLWDTASGGLQKALPWEKGDAALTLLPGADKLAAVASDGTVKVWDLPGGTVSRKLAGPSKRLRQLGFSADRKLLAGSNRSDNNPSADMLHLWDEAGKERFSVASGYGGTSAIALSPDGNLVVASSYDTNVRAWNSRDGELVRLIEDLPLSMFAMAFSPDGKTLAMGGADRMVHLFDTKTWKQTRSFRDLPDMVAAMAFSPDGKLLVTGGFDETTVRNPVQVLLLHVASGKVVRSVPSPHRVASVAFAPNGKVFAATHGEKEIRLWGVPA